MNTDASVIFGRGVGPFGSSQVWAALFSDTPPPFVADAGPDQTVSAGAACQSSVTLDGSLSTGGSLIYSWSENGTQIATGINPEVTLSLGGHTLVLTVQDDQGQTSSDTVFVLVKDTTPPVPKVTTLPAVTGSCSVTVTAIPTAIDNCAGTIAAVTTNPLTYTIPGTYMVMWTYDDGHGNTATQQQTVVVQVPATRTITTIAYTGAVTSVPNANVTLSATLTAGTGKKAQKLSGQTIAFTLGTKTASAVTDASGSARVNLTAPAAAGSYPLSASYEGDCTFASSSVSKSFTVKKK